MFLYGRNLNQDPVALPADRGARYRGVPMGPIFIQEHKGEEMFGEPLFEGEEIFGGLGHGAES